MSNVLSPAARAFADACHTNALDELETALRQRAADATDCREWDITPTEWRAAIRTALEERGARSAAARALGSARTPRKAASSRENGKLGAAHGVRGGRPTRYLLVDDLGRCVGETRRPGPAGTRCEYGLRTPDGFRAEGYARLVRPSDWTGNVPDREWDA